MRSYITKGIVLTRTDFGEADRILTFLTNDHGKIKAIAKGVRRAKAKLAGSIELFSVSDLTLIPGRRDIDTLISARLVKHYGDIVKDIERTTLAYELLRLTNKATEEQPEPAYFDLLKQALISLNDSELGTQLINLWFNMQLLKIAGHTPNLHTERSGTKLKVTGTYDFHMDHMHFVPEAAEQGPYTASHIKFLRLGFSAARPNVLRRVSGVDKLISATQPLVQTMLKSYVRI